MSAEHSKYGRFHLLLRGWQHGASMRAKPDNLMADPDYEEGYSQGLFSRASAGHKFAEMVGASLPEMIKILRGDE